MSSFGAIDPISNPRAWDFVTIANVNSPGFCQVPEWKRKHEYDVKKGKGTTGATVTFVQKPPAEGSIKFFLWDNGTLGTGHNHFKEWDAFIPLLEYDPTKSAKDQQAFGIYHPALDAIKVKNVVTNGIGSLVHEGAGMYSITVDFLEYFPASKTSAVSTPKGSKTTAPGYVGGAPPGDNPAATVAELQKQAADLAKQAQKAAA